MTPAILLTAFGASSAEARLAYGNIEAAVRKRWPAHEVRWAFTSRRVVARLRAEGVVLATPEEALAALIHDGFTSAAVLPLLTVAGEEHASIAPTPAAGLRAHICRPLLSTEGDIAGIRRALEGSVRPDAANVLVCHGNGKHDVYNDLLVKLGSAFSADSNSFAASIEGRPGDACFPRAAGCVRRTGRLHFVPFMVVAGEHITNDVMGVGANSWKSRLSAPLTTCAPPLGWNGAVIRLFLDRLDEGLALLEREDEHGL
jgi:sirohydrochlorin cobaltochelatase